MTSLPSTTTPVPSGKAAASSTTTSSTAANSAPGNVPIASATPIRGNTSTKNPLKRPPPSTTSRTKPHSTPSGGNSGSTKKRPYRRTKRPKNYCDKSTVTTVTTPTRPAEDHGEHASVNPDGTNVYDAVLGECEDLLRASTEAQRLGRLKMASAYQLLLHTRLVGLGKRFDRSAMMVDHQKARQQQQQQLLEEQQRAAAQQHKPNSTTGEPRKQLDLEPSLQGVSNEGASQNDGSNNESKPDATGSSSSSPGGTTPVVPVALQQLRSILPGNLEMDASMMEHLARAAVELHHQRTGRKKSAEGLLASPLNGGLAAATVATTAASVAEEAPAAKADPASATGNSAATSKASTKKSSVAWTPSEMAIVVKALKEGKDNYTIASTLLPNKTVAQVHAFVKNQQQLAKVNKLQQRQQQQLPGSTDAGTKASTVASAPSAPAQDPKPPEVAHPAASAATTSLPIPAATPAAAPKRGGRGRKPPTTAMNTVPNGAMDVRALLRRSHKSTAAATAAHGNTATTTTSHAAEATVKTEPQGDAPA